MICCFNSFNACLPSASVDGHFLFPYFENCGDIMHLYVVTFHRKERKEKSLKA